MKLPRRVKLFTGRLDAAPFLGVFFLLLLFLLFHTYLVPPPGVQIEEARADLAALPATGHPWIAVAVDQAGRMYYEGQLIDADALEKRLAQRTVERLEPLTLLIRADRRVPQEIIVRLYALARRAGIREVVLAARPRLFPQPGPSSSP
ncbi:MAG: biopolymer transporter ExbD [Verrucomicrobia bacterium]|mgnify:CR=1 FL=1|nr:biopolymer transporter ExbD [Verrucomicrobiota bacterium]